MGSAIFGLVMIADTGYMSGITVSIVSHGHGDMVSAVLRGLANSTHIDRVILTLNVPEPIPVIPLALEDKIKVVKNISPQGFGANHNAAFQYCETPCFCVLNPDIRIALDPFPALLSTLSQANTGIAAPIVLNSSGATEDSVRFFPTPFSILQKALGLSRGNYSIAQGSESLPVDWVAGMCMLFRSDAYRSLAGFDERFFLYYEDVDICARAWKQGMSVRACPTATVIHDAQRTSHRDLKFMRWHLFSMMRFFAKHLGRLPNSKEITT